MINLFELLIQTFPNIRISSASGDLAQHARDQSSHSGHLPDVIAWPRSTEEVSSLLAFANEHQVPVVPWGAGTSLEGNPIPVKGGLVLNFDDMAQILSVHAEDFQVTVQPGVRYKDMNKILARVGLFFAPDPGANASVGGMVANNAAGIRTVKYGATRDNVLALEVVLANGQVIHTGARAVKQSAGYDLTHLFVGSEGTLGVITAATLRLAPLPEYFSAATVAFPDVTTAARAVFEIIGGSLEPAALELLDARAILHLNTEEGIDMPYAPHLLMEFHGASENSLAERLEMASESCSALGGYQFQAGLGRQARDRLWEVRHRMFEILVRENPGKEYLITDVAVPISAYPELIASADQAMQSVGVEAIFVCHAGDGNMHANVFFPPGDPEARARADQYNVRLVTKALDLGGTSTGEHGVGLGKQKFMRQEHGPALDVMRQIKTTLDPKGILNPGKILDL